MPEISEYDNLGTPQGEEQFVVARGGTTKNLLWDTIKAYLQTKYLGYGLGVSTGDSHAHVSGRGAQIDHTGLSNIGTNTHAQIDAFVGGAREGWVRAIKTADQTTTEWLEYDDDLVAPISQYQYAYRAKIWFAVGAGHYFVGFLQVGVPTSNYYEKAIAYAPGSTTGTVYKSSATNCDIIEAGAAGVGLVEIDGIFNVINSYPSNLRLLFGNGYDDGASVTVYAGSYIEILKID